MCVSLLERVKQGKSNIILILILSARSQDRDTSTTQCCLDSRISIHSVARPRRVKRPLPSDVMIFQSTRSQDRDWEMDTVYSGKGISIHSVARPRHGYTSLYIPALNISIHSVARPRPGSVAIELEIEYFNPLGRKTETAKLNNY